MAAIHISRPMRTPAPATRARVTAQLWRAPGRSAAGLAELRGLRRCIRPLQPPGASGNGNGVMSNGASPLSLPDGLNILEVDGCKFVALEQAVTLCESAEAALVKGKEETAALRGELASLQASHADVHKQMVEVARTSRTHFTQVKEQEEELAALRMKIASVVAEAQAAREAEANAVEIALEKLESKVSKAYIDGRDRQLSSMEKHLKAALAAVAEAQEAVVTRVRAAEAQSLKAIDAAVGRLEAEATSSARLAVASADSARTNCDTATAGLQRALQQQAETTSLAQQLYAEAKLATDRAAAAHAECSSLQAEVAELRAELKMAAEARVEALKVSAENQADSVRRIREVLESSEGRVQEMYHAFEALKHNERQNAKAARDEAAHHAWRCQEAEGRERALVEKERHMKEALAQALSRARAAEDKLEERSVSLESEFAQKVELMKQQSNVEKESGVAAAAANAHKATQETVDAAKRDASSAQSSATAERDSLRQMLSTAAEENAYWRERAQRAEQAVKDMMHDVKIAAKALPDDKNKLKLRFQSAEMKLLVENGAADLEQLKLHDGDADKANSAPPMSWLPPPPGVLKES